MAERFCLGRWLGRTRHIRAMAQEAAGDAGRTNDTDDANVANDAIRECCPVHQGKGRARAGLI